jgi:transglutaminase-like putative cysteine protease
MVKNTDGEITHAVANLNAALRDEGRDVYVSANRLRRGGMSAANHVAPDAVADTAQDLIDRSDPGPDDSRHVARIFDYVRDDIDYEHTGGGFNYPPDDLLDHGQGNCVDQSVLLCSLLESIGFTTRLYSIKREGGGHMLAGVSFGTANQNRIWDDLADYYTGGVGGMQFDFATQTPVSENARYTIVDPEYSEYPGDISKLADDGYVTQLSTGWEFTNLKRTVKPCDAASSL